MRKAADAHDRSVSVRQLIWARITIGTIVRIFPWLEVLEIQYCDDVARAVLQAPTRPELYVHGNELRVAVLPVCCSNSEVFVMRGTIFTRLPSQPGH